MHTIKFAKAVREKMDEYHHKIEKDEIKTAAALDPRTKNMLDTNPLESAALKLLIKKDYEDNFLDQYS